MSNTEAVLAGVTRHPSAPAEGQPRHHLRPAGVGPILRG